MFYLNGGWGAWNWSIFSKSQIARLPISNISAWQMLDFASLVLGNSACLEFLLPFPVTWHFQPQISHQKQVGLKKFLFHKSVKFLKIKTIYLHPVIGTHCCNVFGIVRKVLSHGSFKSVSIFSIGCKKTKIFIKLRHVSVFFGSARRIESWPFQIYLHFLDWMLNQRCI